LISKDFKSLEKSIKSVRGKEMPPPDQFELNQRVEEFKRTLSVRPHSLAVIVAPESRQTDAEADDFGRRMAEVISVGGFAVSKRIAIRGIPYKDSGRIGEFSIVANSVEAYFRRLDVDASAETENHNLRHEETMYALAMSYTDSSKRLWANSGHIAVVSYVGAKHLVGFDQQEGYSSKQAQSLHKEGSVLVPEVSFAPGEDSPVPLLNWAEAQIPVAGNK
jgi:hypothetical protein